MLHLSLKMLSQFTELHLTPPAIDRDIPSAIEALKSKALFFEGESQKAAAKAAAAKAAAPASAPVAAPVHDEPTPPPSVDPVVLDA